MVFWKRITLFVFLIGASAHAQPYGLSNAVPIAPYLNNVLPHSAPNSSATWDVEVMYTNVVFDQPMFMTPYPRTNWEVLVEKTGIIMMFPHRRDIVNSDIKGFLDIRSRVFTVSDSGMPGIAFHPQFGQAGSTNRGFVYVMYKWRPNPDLGANPDYAYIRLSRFTVPDGQMSADATSEQILVQQLDLQEWHDGSCLMFGLDGFLYFSIGDEGGANDQYNVTQVINQRLMSGIFRVDVNKNAAISHPIRRQPFHHPSTPAGWPESFTTNYFVPNDNPFLDQGGSVLEEYYALGLRNAYKFSQDPVSGQIWAGDVGQDTREEVDVIVKGGNYQWAFREGSINGPKTSPATVIGTQKAPLWDYPHANGEQCVIGGYIYRGTKFSQLLGGKYIFCDNGSGRIWAITSDGLSLGSIVQLATMPSGSVYGGTSSCGMDADGEIYFLKFGGVGAGQIFRLKTIGTFVSEPPALLSQTGAFSDLATLTPAPGLHPYMVNSPLWSDRAAKKRWIAVPNDGTHNTPDEQIVFSRDEWRFPKGTVFVKHFDLPINDTNGATQRLETRFLVMDDSGGAYGVTYKWRADGSDADLLYAGATADYPVTGTGNNIRTQAWQFPSRQDCLFCHNANAGYVVGVKTHQLNGNLLYPGTGVTDNQLRAMGHIGLFTTNYNEAQISTYAKSCDVTNGSASLELRVRSYLAGNCAQCHRPGGVQSYFDARFSTPIEQQNLIYGPTYGFINGPEDRVVIPGDLPHSLLRERVNRVGMFQMPPLARNVIDTNAVQTITDWINSLPPGPGVVLTLLGSSGGSLVSGIFSVQVQFTAPVTGLNSNQFVVGNANVLGLTGSGTNYTLTLEPESEGTVTVQLPTGQVTDAGGHTNYASNLLKVNYQSLSAGLVTWLLLDEAGGTTANDASGNDNNGTLYNMASGSHVSGLIGSALSFDGVDDFIEISNSVGGNFTLAAWLKTAQAFPTAEPTYAGTGIIWSDVGGANNDFILGGTRSSGGLDRLSFFVGPTETTINGATEISSGQWTHIAATRNQTNGEIKVYVNGHLDGTAVGSTSMLNANSLIHIGGNTLDNRYFQGVVDDVRLYSRVLAESEIVALFNSVSPPYVSSLSNLVLNANTSSGPLPFTVGSSAVPADSLTVVASSSNPTLLPQANIILGGSGSNRTVTVTPIQNRSGSAQITLSVSDGQLSAQVAFTVTVRGSLVSWYKFDETTGNVAADSSGHGNNGTLNNMSAVAHATGLYGNALNFDGTNDYVAINNVVGADFTIAAWLKTSQTFDTVDPTYFGTGIFWSDIGGAQNDFIIGGTRSVAGVNRLSFFAGNTEVTVSGGTEIASGQWTHIAVTRLKATGEMKLYVNGHLDGTGLGSTNLLTANPLIHIGGNTSDGHYFRGLIDDARLYDYALDATEVAALVNTAPMLLPIADRTIVAGATLTITNVASDAQSPPQKFTFSLVGSGYGATLNSSNGLFVWRPLIAQGGTTNQFTIKVSDDGVPSLSTSQTFQVIVNSASVPLLSDPVLAPGQFQILISGDAGPDYLIQTSSNLVDWVQFMNTNPSALPFLFFDPSPAKPARFYRVRLGP